MSERQIDKAIDDAVRDLMNVDADPAFRARVVERLRQPKSHGPFWRQFAVAAAAVVVVAIGVALMRQVEEPGVEDQPAPVASTAAPQPALEPRADSPAPPAASRPPRRPAIRPGASQPTHAISRGALVATVADEPPADLVIASNTDDVTPLPAIQPIEVAALPSIPAISTAPIVVEPVTPLSELGVAPLAPRGERK
jgi:hypothetical protein